MNFTKLPANSEKLLQKLVATDNPAQMLCARFAQASQQEDDELRCILRELREKGYINLKWADNMPYYVTLNNSARTYQEMLAEYRSSKSNLSETPMNTIPVIFISHRSTDKEIADMLLDFFSCTGIPRENVFCSSLPGNDIMEKISGEVKVALKNSVVSIAILSRDYYQSAYCLNEAGILWFQEDVPVIPIALPEINSSNMYGFLSNEYKLRRLDSDTDIPYIYDVVRKNVSARHIKTETVVLESNKLKMRYVEFLKARSAPIPASVDVSFSLVSEITTDDERIILYYVLEKGARKITKTSATEWLNKNEIRDVDVDNAFDLLSSIDGGTLENNTLRLGITAFRKYSANASTILKELRGCVDRHKVIAADTFVTLWKEDRIDPIVKMLFAYIVDEKISTFGDRWMAEKQIASIRAWENKNNLLLELSSNYERGLQFLLQNRLVYENGWTDHGNVREYALYPSLQKLLFNCPQKVRAELEEIKEEHGLPF